MPELGRHPDANPTGHAEVRTPHATMDTPQHAVNSGDVTTSFIVLGVLAGQAFRKGRDVIAERKENH